MYLQPKKDFSNIFKSLGEMIFPPGTDWGPHLVIEKVRNSLRPSQPIYVIDPIFPFKLWGYLSLFFIMLHPEVNFLL